MKIRVLIVDDEAPARSVIRHWLADKTDVEIVRECADGEEALATLRQHPVDLVFLDVQMPELDGFELLRRARETEIPVVIFVTAHDQYALRAFETHALDYLLKPFDKERFDAAFNRARAELERARVATEYRTRLKDLVEALDSRGAGGDAGTRRPAYHARLSVRQDGRIVLVRPADVRWIEAEGDYVRIHTRDRRYLAHDTLNRFAAQLDPRLFMRIHRSAVVNVDCIRELEPCSNGEFEILLQDGQKLRSSRTYRGMLLAALGRPAG